MGAHSSNCHCLGRAKRQFDGRHHRGHADIPPDGADYWGRFQFSNLQPSTTQKIAP